MNEWGKWIVGIGLLLIVIGLIIHFGGHKLSWIGNLPGDIRIKKDNFNFYFPITTMILLSIVINVVLRVYRYFIH